MRPTKKRIEEIRKNWEGCCNDQDELLAEIDALEADLDQAVTEFCKKIETVTKERDQLKAENERLMEVLYSYRVM